MATKLKAAGRSFEGHYYEVFFDQDEVSGTPLEVPLVDVKYNYKGSTDRSDAPFILSTCEVTILLQNNAQLSRLQQMIDGDESRNKIRVLKNSNIDWLGVIQVELATEEDRSFPYEYKITATDGIARLKTVPYLGGGVGEDEYYSLLDHIKTVLEKSPIIDYFSIDEEFLRTHITKWPDEITPDDDINPLTELRVSTKAFRTVDKSGEVTYMSSYDVLNAICVALGLRFYFGSGRFVLDELIDVIRQDDEVIWHRYDKEFNNLDIETLTDRSSWQTTIATDLSLSDVAKMLSGGKITFEPPVKSVSYTYKHYSKQNLLPGYTWPFNGNVAEVLNFRADGGVLLRIFGVVKVRLLFPSDEVFPNAAVHLVVNMSCWVEYGNSEDSVAVSRTYNFAGVGFNYSPMEWVEGGLGTEFPIIANAQEEGDVYTSFDFVTPSVPESGTLKLSFSIGELLLNGEPWLDADPVFNVEDVFIGPIVEGNVENQFQYTFARASNSDFQANSDREPREIIIGDGPTENTFGRIEARTESGDWQLTTAWRRYADGNSLSGDSETLIRLLTNDLLSMRNRKLAQLDTAFISPDYAPGFTMNRGGDIYLLNRGTFNLLRDEVSGTWIQITRLAVEIPDIAVIDSDLGDIGGGGILPPPLPPGLGSTPPPGALGPGQLGENTVVSTISTLLEAGETYTLLDIDVDAADLPLIAGTQLIITHPYTGQTQTVTLTQDYLEGIENPWVDPDGNTWITPGGDNWIVDSSPGLSVASFVSDYDFPVGSYIQILSQSEVQINDTLRQAYETFTVFEYATTVTAGVAGMYWRPVQRVGWKITGVSLALGSNDNENDITVAVKHDDGGGNVVTVATYQGSALTFFGPLDNPVVAGHYFCDLSNVGASINGLQVTFQLRKQLEL